MKAFIAAVVLSFATVMQAGTWQHVGRNVYRGDTYYWHAYCVCGCWKYEKLCPVANCPAPGTPDFWSRMAELNVKADELQSEADYVKSRWPGRLVGANVETTGYQVLQQGYIQGGTTLQSTGLAISPVDVNGIIHEAQRLQELAGVNSSQANAQVNTIVNSAVEGNSAAARIMAAGQVAAATIAASVPPVQQTTVFQSKTLAAPGFQAASPVTTGDAVSLLSHGLLMQNCSGCHSPRKLSGNLDLTVDPAGLGAVRALIEQKIVSGEMPKGHPHLAEAVVNGMLAGIPRQTFAATPPIPQQPEDQPPLPPQNQ